MQSWKTNVVKCGKRWTSLKRERSWGSPYQLSSKVSPCFRCFAAVLISADTLWTQIGVQIYMVLESDAQGWPNEEGQGNKETCFVRRKGLHNVLLNFCFIAGVCFHNRNSSRLQCQAGSQPMSAHLKFTVLGCPWHILASMFRLLWVFHRLSIAVSMPLSFRHSERTRCTGNSVLGCFRKTIVAKVAVRRKSAIASPFLGSLIVLSPPRFLGSWDWMPPFFWLLAPRLARMCANLLCSSCLPKSVLYYKMY